MIDFSMIHTLAEVAQTIGAAFLAGGALLLWSLYRSAVARSLWL